MLKRSARECSAKAVEKLECSAEAVEKLECSAEAVEKLECSAEAVEKLECSAEAVVEKLECSAEAVEKLECRARVLCVRCVLLALSRSHALPERIHKVSRSAQVFDHEKVCRSLSGVPFEGCGFSLLPASGSVFWSHGSPLERGF